MIARKPREAGDDWFGAASYFGGLPKLGPAPWPPDAGGKPLHFMAQLDLAEIDRASSGRSALPKTGALAFFLGGSQGGSRRGGILHVPEPGRRFTPAPSGRGSLEDVDIDDVVNRALPHGPHEVPFWAVTFEPIARVVPEGDDYVDAYSDARDAQYADIAAKIERRRYNFTLDEACAKAGLTEKPLYWLAAIMFAERVPSMLEAVAAARLRGAGYVEAPGARLAALEAGLPPPPGQGRWGAPGVDRENAERWIAIGQKAIVHADENESAVAAFIAQVKATMPDIDPFRLVTPNDAEKLDVLFDPARKPPLDEYSRYRLPRSWRDFGGHAVRLMASGSEEAFTRLPKALREVIFQSYRLPAGGAHLMFGLGTDIQGNPKFESRDEHLVLQLCFDDMLGWRFGDNGVFQFWMNEAALQAGDFSKADITFECH